MLTCDLELLTDMCRGKRTESAAELEQRARQAEAEARAHVEAVRKEEAERPIGE